MKIGESLSMRFQREFESSSLLPVVSPEFIARRSAQGAGVSVVFTLADGEVFLVLVGGAGSQRVRPGDLSGLRPVRIKKMFDDVCAKLAHEPAP